MTAPTVFVIKNQADLFLNKQMEWIEAGDGHTLYRTAHRDEAINTVFEVSAKDIYLRAEAFVCRVDAKGQPAVKATDLQTKTAAVELEESLDDIPDEVASAPSSQPESSDAPDDVFHEDSADAQSAAASKAVPANEPTDDEPTDALHPSITHP